ncbi:phage portal protein [Tenacibaculum sp. C7A-26P2]|uniref:phage portal protein n=1 Tax=Tenacibaculum sp. C7A-26P2 TaxID=3447504 RepID=UPI003F85F61E
MNFLELLQSNQIEKAYNLLSAKEGVSDSAKEFNNDRKVRDTQVGNREDKIMKDGTINRVSKVPIPFQRQIVKTASTFLLGSPVKLVDKESNNEINEAFESISDLWHDLRLDSLLLDFCKTVKSETEATIVFFPVKKEDDSEPRIKARLLKNKNGKVYPIFDAFGDMTAFAWEYVVKEDNKDVFYLYIWTDSDQYIYKKQSKDWLPEEGYPKANLFKKIPVVYLSQENPEWWEVQGLIDMFENSFSKFVDTNGYFSSPMYKAKGAVSSIPKKDSSGKMVKLDIIETDRGNIIEADLDVISWDRAPEALKLEFETGKGLIYGLSDTPDLSFDNVKGIGNISGIALKLMFLGPILKAKESEGDYQVVISRIINLLKVGLSKIIKPKLEGSLKELRIDIKFTSILPENLKETIEILSQATGGKPILSQETASAHNPMVENSKEEIELMRNEQEPKKEVQKV